MACHRRKGREKRLLRRKNKESHFREKMSEPGREGGVGGIIARSRGALANQNFIDRHGVVGGGAKEVAVY